MVRGKELAQPQPPEQSSFPLAFDGDTPEELLKAGNYDWVSDYARQIVHSKFCAVGEAEIEIVLLAHRGLATLSSDDMRTLYGLPEVGDAVRFGAQYPDEQRKSPIVFPHEPWAGPHRISFVLVLRTDEDRARGGP